MPVDFEDAGFDAPDVQRHDVLVSALDHVLSRTLEEIDRLHVARSANLDAIAAALGSAMTGIDMLYLSREPTPISGAQRAAAWVSRIVNNNPTAAKRAKCTCMRVVCMLAAPRMHCACMQYVNACVPSGQGREQLGYSARGPEAC